MFMTTPNVKTMKDLLTRDEFRLPKPGSILSGTIVSVSKGSVLVDLGPVGMGIVYPGEFLDSPDRMRALAPGHTVSAVLLELENEDGYRELSLRSAQMTTAWQRIRQAKEEGTVISAPVTNINKGGLIVEVEGVQGFLPLSQLSAEHYPKVEGGDTAKIVQALQKFKGAEMKVKVLDFIEEEKKLIVSERAIRDEAVREEIAKLSVGAEVTGTISEVTDFGAFLKISDTLDGLIHASEMSWGYVEDPRTLLEVGAEVKAKIIGLDGGRVSLSMKALTPDPWLNVADRYSVGAQVTGTVVKLRSHGAFVALDKDIVGMVPMAELEKTPLIAGEKRTFTISAIEPAEHKLLLATQ